MVKRIEYFRRHSHSLVKEVAGHLITDIQIFNQDDFTEKGRFNMTQEKFYFPSSAYVSRAYPCLHQQHVENLIVAILTRFT